MHASTWLPAEQLLLLSSTLVSKEVTLTQDVDRWRIPRVLELGDVGDVRWTLKLCSVVCDL